MAFGAALALGPLGPAPARAAKPDRVVVAVATWQHPTKAVFASSRLRLERVELHRRSVYPVFYVSGPGLSSVVTDAFARQLSAANAWWPSEIRHLTAEGLSTIRSAGADGRVDGDIEADQVVVLATRRRAKVVTVERLLSADQAIDRAAAALGGAGRPPVVVNGERITFSFLLDGVPTVPYAAPAFWSVSLGENHPDHRVTLRRVDVDAATGAVWEIDPITGERTKRLRA